MSDYLTLTEYKITAETIGYAFDEADARRSITAISRGIDEHCDRIFYNAGTQTRTFTPTDPRLLYFDSIDLITASTVQLDMTADGVYETTLSAASDYLLEPQNAANDAKPYERIRMRSFSSYYFPCYEASVSITGAWGWATVPEQVHEVATFMARRLVTRKRDAPGAFGVVGIGIDQMPVRIARVDPDFQWLLEPLKRGSGVLAA